MNLSIDKILSERLKRALLPNSRSSWGKEPKDVEVITSVKAFWKFPIFGASTKDCLIDNVHFSPIFFVSYARPAGRSSISPASSLLDHHSPDHHFFAGHWDEFLESNSLSWNADLQIPSLWPLSNGNADLGKIDISKAPCRTAIQVGYRKAKLYTKWFVNFYGISQALVFDNSPFSRRLFVLHWCDLYVRYSRLAIDSEEHLQHPSHSRAVVRDFRHRHTAASLLPQRTGC